MKNNRSIAGGVVAVSIALIAAILAFNIMPRGGQSEKLLVKIGVALPLSGDNQENGNIAKQAISMFQDDLSKRELKNDYKFVIEDADVLQIRKTMSATNKMISYDKVDAIISYWNSPGIITSEILKNKNILHINFGSDPRTLQSPSDFNYYVSQKELISTLLEKAEKDGIKTAVILNSNIPGRK